MDRFKSVSPNDGSSAPFVYDTFTKKIVFYQSTSLPNPKKMVKVVCKSFEYEYQYYMRELTNFLIRPV